MVTPPKTPLSLRSRCEFKTVSRPQSELHPVTLYNSRFHTQSQTYQEQACRVQKSGSSAAAVYIACPVSRACRRSIRRLPSVLPPTLTFLAHWKDAVLHSWRAMLVDTNSFRRS